MAGTPLNRFTQTTSVFNGSFETRFPMATTSYLRSDGGRFLTTASGIYALTAATDTKIDGWTNICFKTTHDGNQGKTPYITDSVLNEEVSGTTDIHSERFACWLPVATGSTIDGTYLGKACDLVIEGSTTTTKQCVAIAVTTHNQVKIVGVDTVNNLALVYANPSAS